MNTLDIKHLRGRMLAAIAACALCVNASAALPSGTVLQFNPGVPVCDDSGTYPNCDSSTWQVTSGSYVFFDFDNNGVITGYEKNPITMHDGLILGVGQPATGSHPGFPDGSETPGIDQPWPFFGNTGMTLTVSPVADYGDGTLDFSGWGFTWAGIPYVHVGDPAYFPGIDTHRATLICSHNPCQIGDSYTLDYRGHVPYGDPSGFGGVFMGLHLEGTVLAGNLVPRVSLQIIGGATQECSSHGGTSITMIATTVVPEGDTLASLNWTLDGNPVGSGLQIQPLVSLGTHTARVEAVTAAGHSAVATANVTIRDTTAPVVTAAFINQRTGQPVSQITKDTRVVIKAEATDVCDPHPTVASMVGLPVNNNDRIKIRVEEQRLTLDEATRINLSVTGTDASGNSTNGQASLSIAP